MSLIVFKSLSNVRVESKSVRKVMISEFLIEFCFGLYDFIELGN